MIVLPSNTCISIVPRQLHFKQPAGTSRGVYYIRCIWYIILRSVDNPERFGVGECAPLPDLSCDALADYEYVLGDICRRLEGIGSLDISSLRSYPSILFGLETAIRHFNAGSLRLWDTPFQRGEAGIPINGLIWMGNYQQMLSQIGEKMHQGFRCIKLKIGAIHFDEELDLLKHIRKHYDAGKIEIRVDANGAFPPDDALGKLGKLATLDLHSIEQPIRAGQWKEMRRLVSETPLPIALDEELIGINTLEEKQNLLDTIQPHYIILKPSLHGGIAGCTEWIEEAKKRQIGWWITSALESNIGLNAIAQWTATFDNPLPQGLGTGKLFTDNQPMPLVIEKDCLWYRADKPEDEYLSPDFGSPQSITIDGTCYTPSNISQLLRNESGIYHHLHRFLLQWFDASPTIVVHTSGSTGTPKEITVSKDKMMQSAYTTCSFLNLQAGDKALLCMPLDYIGGKMLVVRAITNGLNLVVCEPSGHPLANLEIVPDFAAMTPMQVYNSLQVPAEAERLRQIKRLIIGGGAIDHEMQKCLADFPHEVYSTYGMTETLSHIALRRLNGPEASDYYTPFSSVKLTLSQDNALIIDAPWVSNDVLQTNDIAQFLPDGSFKILGRRDNVVNCGGIKMQLELIEAKLRPAISGAFALTSIPDSQFGESLVLLTEYDIDAEELKACVSKYEFPKHIHKVQEIPRTGNGKIDRAACKRLAMESCITNNR